MRVSVGAPSTLRSWTRAFVRTDRDQLLRISPLTLSEPRLKGVGAFEDTVADRDGSRTALEISTPHGAAVSSSHLWLHFPLSFTSNTSSARLQPWTVDNLDLVSA